MVKPEELYSQLVEAFKAGHWRDARALALELLPLAPVHAGVYGMAGVVSLQLQQPTEAVSYLQRATALDPKRADFATLYAKALLAEHLPGPARREADRAIGLKPQDPMALNALGLIFVQTQAHEAATAAFKLAVSLAPTSAPFRLNLATALNTLGLIGAAQRELETCIDLDASSWSAHLLLSQLRPQTSASNHLPRLQALLLEHQNESAAAIFLNLAMAKEREDLGKYPEAFRHTMQGKAAARATRPYSSQRDRDLFEALIRAFPQTAAQLLNGDPSNQSIFIIGMPRSGTTLVERILSSHPDIHAAGELQNFAIALQQESKSHAPFLLDPAMPARTRVIDWKKLGARYLESIRPDTTGHPRFIDKMPHNFLYAGFIANALPNASIIRLRRHPLDTCLGNFRTYFWHPSIHLDYSFDLLDTGRYYILFDRLMAHWRGFSRAASMRCITRHWWIRRQR